jgi:hypothetical protein
MEQINEVVLILQIIIILTVPQEALLVSAIENKVREMCRRSKAG